MLQIKKLKINPSYFIMGIGTGGTIVGIGRRLKEEFPRIKIIGLVGKVEGLKEKESFIVNRGDVEEICDEIIKINVSEEYIKEIIEKVIKVDNLYIGYSSAFNLVAIEEIGLEKDVVTVFMDSLFRYKLEDPIFNFSFKLL